MPRHGRRVCGDESWLPHGLIGCRKRGTTKGTPTGKRSSGGRGTPAGTREGQPLLPGRSVWKGVPGLHPLRLPGGVPSHGAPPTGSAPATSGSVARSRARRTSAGRRVARHCAMKTNEGRAKLRPCADPRWASRTDDPMPVATPGKRRAQGEASTGPRAVSLCAGAHWRAQNDAPRQRTRAGSLAVTTITQRAPQSARWVPSNPAPAPAESAPAFPVSYNRRDGDGEGTVLWQWEGPRRRTVS